MYDQNHTSKVFRTYRALCAQHVHLLLLHGWCEFNMVFSSVTWQICPALVWVMLTGTEGSSADLMPLVSVCTWQLARAS